MGVGKLVTGPNINIYIPGDEGVFLTRSDYEGIPVASPIRVYLDLMTIKGRGEEAAETLMEKVIKPQW